MATPDDDSVTERSLRDAEAAHLAARDTVALDLSHPAGPRRRPSDTELFNMPTVRLPRQRPPGSAVKRGTPLAVAVPVAALVNTGWAALICLLPLLAIVTLAPLSAGQAAGVHSIPYALAGWLLAHGVQVRTEIGPLGLAPLALTMLAVWRVNRAGVHVTRALGARGTGSTRYALLAAGSVGLAYGLLGLLTAAIADRPGLGVDPWWALLKFAVVGFVAALAGSIRATGALSRLARATPLVLRDGLRTGVVGGLLLVGLGGGAAGLAIALAGGEASEFIAAFRTGLAGQTGLTLLCLAYAPNLAIWSSAYLLGPGFAVGAGTTVRTGEVEMGQLPPLPMFAGLPEQPLPVPTGLLMVVPILAGVAAGLLLVWRRVRPRRTRDGDTVLPRPHWARLGFAAATSGPVAGVLLACATFVSAGPLGGGRLAEMGPATWQIVQSSLMAAAVVSLGALFGVLAGVAVWELRNGSQPA